MRRRNLLLSLGAVLVCVLVFELVLRLLGLSFPEINRLDPRLGWSPRPGLRGLYALEGRAEIAINQEGFRDRDHRLERAEAVLRIAVIGDSVTEGREVALDRLYWKVMERALADCLRPSGRTPEVMGFAVNGYGTAQELLVLRDHVLRYRPDLVLLALFSGNDISNNDRTLDRHPDRPYFLLRDGALVLDDSGLESARFGSKKLWSDVRHGIYNQIRTLQLARHGYKVLKTRRKASRLGLEEQLMSGLSADLYRAPVDEAWRNAWRVTEALILRMRGEVRGTGADFRLVVLTNPVQVYPDPAVRQALAAALGVPDLTYPDRRLADFAARHDMPATFLVDPLRARAEAERVRLHGFGTHAGGHWNEIGHRFAGEELAKDLCRTYAADDAAVPEG